MSVRRAMGDGRRHRVDVKEVVVVVGDPLGPARPHREGHEGGEAYDGADYGEDSGDGLVWC